MYRLLRLVCITLIFLITFTSCFQIEEIITFKDRESGTVQYMVDLSSMMSMVKMLGNMSEDSVNSETPDATTMLANSFGQVKTELEKIEGVSNVSQIDDGENSRFGIKADFATIKALNTVLSLLYDASENKETHTYSEFIRRKKNTFEYLEPVDIRANIEKSLMLPGTESKNMGGIDPMMFFNDLSVSSKLVFSDKSIKKISNTHAVISGDTVALTSYPFRKENTVKLKNTVRVK